MAKIYKRKPIEVEAIQLIDNDQSISDVIEFVDNIDMSTCLFLREACIKQVKDNGCLIIKTPEGELKDIVSFGDFIIKDINGEKHICKPDIFYKTYELIDY